MYYTTHTAVTHRVLENRSSVGRLADEVWDKEHHLHAQRTNTIQYNPIHPFTKDAPKGEGTKNRLLIEIQPNLPRHNVRLRAHKHM